jgi:hypothetical protein
LRRIVRAPGNKGDLAPRALAALELVLDVKDGVAAADALLALAVLALGVEQLFTETGPVALRRCLLNHNFLPVVADLVDDVFDRLAQLEVVERADALGGYGDAVERLVSWTSRKAEFERSRACSAFAVRCRRHGSL